jgi:ribA/ribD-fused uncharacterized protein
MLNLKQTLPGKCIDEFIGPYRFLSNFYPAVVKYKSNNYPTVEHAYQAAKTVDDCTRMLICAAKSPGIAKRMGRRVNLRSDWEEVKLDVMLGLLRQKFSTDPLKTKLLDTYPAELIEGNDWGDTFYGICHGVGQNHLGKLLMRVRGEILGSVLDCEYDQR